MLKSEVDKALREVAEELLAAWDSGGYPSLETIIKARDALGKPAPTKFLALSPRPRWTA